MIAAIRVRFGRTGLREAMRQRVREAAARRLEAMEGPPAPIADEPEAAPGEPPGDFLTKT